MVILIFLNIMQKRNLIINGVLRYILLAQNTQDACSIYFFLDI
jgi:hypothetical protein